ncbi:MAG: CoA transferase [Alphaproteobacteria bacterium]|nr:CoA transferase [Alphaproteobacteria bacterium]
MTVPDLPLVGIRVVEFAHMVMGPTCGLVLADLGAEVIKIEPVPSGDNTRRLTGSGAGFFAMFNRNKRSLALDLKSPKGREIVLRLIGTADVVTENFRPGAMAGLGLDYTSLRRLNPCLIYASHKGFLAGPYESRTALDEVAQMMGGLAYMTGLPDRPLRAGSSVIDIMGGMFGAMGVMAALVQRQRTGQGQEVTSSLFESVVLLMGQHMAYKATTGKALPPMSIRVAAWAVYDVFETADGQRIFIGVVSDTQWKQFCEAFDRPDLLADESLATNVQRVHARDRLIPIVAEVFKKFAKAELMEKCEATGLPFAPITRPEDLFDDPHLNTSGGLLDVTLPDGTPTKLPALPLEMAGRRFGLRHDLPKIGEYGRETLAGLGYSVAEIDTLINDKVITVS